ncbi:MAG: response regulator transcription factor [Candidatus Melainabacteria bacterium]|nr:response regulator transcription factor [Candidatus Melainabacteria bacterium]
MAKVLIVEDDAALRLSVADELELEGYAVETVASAEAAIEILAISDFDLVVLDWELPNMSGLELCGSMRRSGKRCGILFLTGRFATRDKTSGLDAGADDYLTKPFEPDELLARVRAILRRGTANRDDQIQIGDIQINLVTRSILKNGTVVVLKAKEQQLVEFLVRHRGALFSLDDLIRNVWSSDELVSYDAVRQCVKRVREKLDAPGKPSFINTVKGIGYIVE